MHLNAIRTRLGMAIVAATLVAWPTSHVVAAGQQQKPTLDDASGKKIRVRIVNAPPGSTIEIALTGVKYGDAAVGPDGTGESVLNLGSIGKTRAQVFVRVCKDGKVQVILWTGDGAPPKDQDCDDTPVGIIWLDKADTLTIGVQPPSMSVEETGISIGDLFKNPFFDAAVVTAGTLVVRAATDNDTVSIAPVGTTPPGTVVVNPNPNPPAPTPPPTPPPTPTPPPAPPARPDGIFSLAWDVIEDLRQSAQFVLLQNSHEAQITTEGSLTISASRAGFTMTGQAPLPALRGTWDPATNQVTASGNGPLAGRPNVSVTLTGTLTAAGALSATVTVGEDGSLGPPLPHIIRYRLTGTKR